MPRALEVIEKELLEGENRLKVALDIVKLAGIQISNIGPHDPDAIVAEEVRSRDTTLLLCLGGQTNFAQVRQDLLEKGGD